MAGKPQPYLPSVEWAPARASHLGLASVGLARPPSEARAGDGLAGDRGFLHLQGRA